MSIDPLVLFSIQFTFALLAYALVARWYAWPRIKPLPVTVALVPLVWVHVFRFVGGSILAPGSVSPGVPEEFREMVGYGDMEFVRAVSPALRNETGRPASSDGSDDPS